MGKLGWKERKAVETFIQLLKICPEDKVPPAVYDELAKSGLVKYPDENMNQFSSRILEYIKNVEKTI